MSFKPFAKAGLLSLLVAVAVCTATGMAQAKKKSTPQVLPAPLALPAPEVTGAIDPRNNGINAPAPSVIRARAAMEKFAEARAAMDHGLLLRDATPKSDIVTIQSSMKGTMEDLAAVEQIEQLASSAKDAHRLVDDWYQSGMKIIAPPASGLTEMPLPMMVRSKADAAVTALDWLVEEAAANAPPKAASAAPATRVAAAVPVTPAQAAPPMHVAAPKSITSMRERRVGRKVLLERMPKPIDQNEASARLLREALPLFLPPAVLFVRKDDGRKH
jgi:hypothetical protein